MGGQRNRNWIASILTPSSRAAWNWKTDLRHSGLVLRGTLLGQEPLAIVESATDPNQSWLVREGDEVLGEKILRIGGGWVEVLVNGVHTRRLEAE